MCHQRMRGDVAGHYKQPKTVFLKHLRELQQAGLVERWWPDVSVVVWGVSVRGVPEKLAVKLTLLQTKIGVRPLRDEKADY